MALPYTKVNWQDGVTPENASTLGQMDQGIKDLDDAVQAILAGGTGGGVEYENVWGAGTAYQAGDVVNYGGVEYLAVNPSTGQTPPVPAAPPVAYGTVPLVTVLPASPFDGQEVIFVDSLTAPTFQWRLRYAAAIADAYKWLVVGGPNAASEVPGSTGAISSASYVASGGPTIFVPRSGIYGVEIGANILAAGAAGSRGYMSYDIGATAAVDADALEGGEAATTPLGPGTVTFVQRKALTGGDTLTAKYRVTANSCTFTKRYLGLRPVRLA